MRPWRTAGRAAMASRFAFAAQTISRQRLLASTGRHCGRFSSAAAKAAAPRPAPVPPAKGEQSLPVRFAAWYEACLAARPLPTKMVTSGVLYAVGDCMGQAIVNARTPAGEARPGFDVGRFLRATAFGGLFYPPVAHLHYNFLEWIVVTRWAVSTPLMPWAKMFLEQFVYWGWFSNGYYHAVLGALQGMGPEQVYRRVADTLWDTLKAQWVFWIPVQLLNFKFVPLRHQVSARTGGRAPSARAARAPARSARAARLTSARTAPRAPVPPAASAQPGAGGLAGVDDLPLNRIPARKGWSARAAAGARAWEASGRRTWRGHKLARARRLAPRSRARRAQSRDVRSSRTRRPARPARDALDPGSLAAYAGCEYCEAAADRRDAAHVAWLCLKSMTRSIHLSLSPQVSVLCTCRQTAIALSSDGGMRRRNVFQQHKDELAARQKKEVRATALPLCGRARRGATASPRRSSRTPRRAIVACRPRRH